MTLRSEHLGRVGVVMFDSWAGRHELRCVVIGETATKYRVAYLEGGKVAGSRKKVQAGDQMLVPKSAVRLDNQFAREGSG